MVSRFRRLGAGDGKHARRPRIAAVVGSIAERGYSASRAAVGLLAPVTGDAPHNYALQPPASGELLTNGCWRSGPSSRRTVWWPAAAAERGR